LIFLISCNNENEGCVRLKEMWKNENLNGVIYLKSDKIAETNILHFKLIEQDSSFQYKTTSGWPLSLSYFLKEGDVINKIKGDSIMYIIKKDTILQYQYDCPQSYINGKPVMEF